MLLPLVPMACAALIDDPDDPWFLALKHTFTASVRTGTAAPLSRKLCVQRHAC